MPSVPKADLVQTLAALGEQAPPSWTVMEIKNRIHELQEAQGTPPRGKKQKAPLAEQMTRLNVASRRKGNLADYMKQELDMHVNPNDTVAQMQRQAIKKIYMTTTASGTDPVGFGDHSALSYQEVQISHPQYCHWVVQTSQEEDHSYMLGRLAQWLILQKTAPPAPKWEKPAAKAKISAKQPTPYPSTPAASNEGTHEMMAKMMDMVSQLKEEVENLKQERPRKKADTEKTESVNSFKLVNHSD